MKGKINLENWYAIIVVGFVLITSLLSWMRFALITYSMLISKAESVVQDNSVDDEIVESSNNKESTIEKINTLFEEVTSYVDRNWIIDKNEKITEIDSLISYYGLGEVISDQVLAGKDGWLFYKSTSDGDPIADYEGTNRYTENEMKQIAQAAMYIQNELENRDIIFSILVAPNKENIYVENMPDEYIHAEESSTDLLIEYLSDVGVNVVSPKEELLDQHMTSQVYYSYDTHWNQLGAYIGVRDVLLSWGINMPKLTERNILKSNLKGNYHYCGGDDLAQMARLRSVFSDEIEYEVEGTIPMEWTDFAKKQGKGEISHFFNENAEINGKIFVIGDSFRSSMIPSLREQFSDVYVVHRDFCFSDMIDEVDPDYIIVEYVERHSQKIKNIEELLK